MPRGNNAHGNEMVGSKPQPERSQAAEATEFNSHFWVTSAGRARAPYSISVKRANMAFRTASLYESAVETP